MTGSDNVKNIIKTPSVINRWRFAGLSAAELLPQLQQYLLSQDKDSNWQLIWLNNDGQPVIGLLPKVSWSAYFESDSQPAIEKVAHYKVIKTCRDKLSPVVVAMSYVDWQDELIAYSNRYENNNNAANSIEQTDDKPIYQHGLIGFIGYDIASFELSPAAANQQTTQPSMQPSMQPCAVLGHYDIYLTLSDDTTNQASSWQLNAQSSNSDNESMNPLLDTLVSYLERLDNKLSKAAIDDRTALSKQQKPTPLTMTPQWCKGDYQRAFAQTQRYLVQGDCYQINLTQAWQGYLNKTHNDKTAPKLLDYLPALHRNTQAPFAGYLASVNPSNENTENTENTNFELLSCSPELFFTFIRDRQTNQNYIRTKPIKGTIPRGVNIEQDYLLKQQLVASDKDRSENVMIVDLLRNDLGKYAKVGSVKVPQLFAIESFSNVHHMVSTITAELKDDIHPLAVLFGSLPAGSITGTPKKRAVEIIAELEIAPRGAYCGTMGYMNFDGSGQWNVLIRTLQSTQIANGDRQVSLWAGGITIASSCDAEYQECLDKVGNLLGVLADR